MDLSWLKWPLILLLVGGVIWLLSEGGVNWMYGQYTKGPVGEDPAVDKRNEAGLNMLGGYMLTTFRYGKAEEILSTAVQRYNLQTTQGLYWQNLLRLSRAVERQGDYARALDMLREIEAAQRAGQIQDERIPDAATLKLRADKLMETHELGEISS